MSIPNDFSTYEKMANMANIKNFLGGSVVEIFKQNIKRNKMIMSKKCYISLKRNLKYTWSLWLYFPSIIKYMIGKFKITEVDIPYINAVSFYNDILKDN